jgi:hypothetical protein
MNCSVEGNLLTGHGDMQVDDTRIKGKATISMSMQGMKMEMKTSWTGKRLGACN